MTVVTSIHQWKNCHDKEAQAVWFWRWHQASMQERRTWGSGVEQAWAHRQSAEMLGWAPEDLRQGLSALGAFNDPGLTAYQLRSLVDAAPGLKSAAIEALVWEAVAVGAEARGRQGPDEPEEDMDEEDQDNEAVESLYLFMDIYLRPTLPKEPAHLHFLRGILAFYPAARNHVDGFDNDFQKLTKTSGQHCRWWERLEDIQGLLTKKDVETLLERWRPVSAHPAHGFLESMAIRLITQDSETHEEPPAERVRRRL